ncbi:F-box domain, Leucine-rich repeat domain, L domain-like protein [Artemisia annua]|uniref:F-box domain, Leucine-rich repeat domain, L domain-like protein n=1 Tax=Artemisia annua TaxID=35608 RepID=A0A2U1LPD6_ARTAN|nr:F-box domain, Leucine-rich repeat domain, L domain-like protein [Artemisia annua]
MNEVKKLCAEDDSSSFGRLPEDIVLQILNKLIDLKTLCLCKLVSKRFTSIVSQVETIFFTFSTYPLVDAARLGSYGSAIGSLMTFQCVKSLHIQFPSFFDNHFLFKWKVNFRIRPDSFIFLSPNSVCNNKESNVNENSQEALEEQDRELTKNKANIMVECLKDAMMRVTLLLHVTRLPSLENVVITDLGKRGKVSLSGGKVDDLNDWISSCSVEIIEKSVSSYFISQCYVPLLKLPVSGYLMKGVKLYILQWNDLMGDISDSIMKSDNDDAFEDKEEAAYSEALMEIFKKHSDRIERLDL